LTDATDKKKGSIGLSFSSLHITIKTKNNLTSKRYDVIMLSKCKKEVIMSTLSKRATVYLDPILYKALRIKSLETSKSMSKLIDEAIRLSFAEDAEDLAAFEKRANEPLISFEDVLKELKKDGRI